MTLEAELGESLRRLEYLVAEATGRMRASDPDPANAFRGLYITDEQIDLLFERSGREDSISGATLAPSQGSRLHCLLNTFDLEPIDLDILVVALAPDLDRRFEQFYGYLQDDVTRRRASPGLVFELLGVTPFDALTRGRLSGEAPLVAHRLLEVEDPERPFLTRGLRVPDRVVDHLLGSAEIEPALASAVVRYANLATSVGEEIANVVASQDVVVYLREAGDFGAMGIGAQALTSAGFAPLVLDLRRIDPAAQQEVTSLALRESRLSGAGLVVGPIDELSDSTIRCLTEKSPRLVLHGRGVWDPDKTTSAAMVVDLAKPDPGSLRSMWLSELPEAPQAVDAVLSSFRLGPEQIRRAVTAGHAFAGAKGVELGGEDLAAGARTQNSAGLERLARRVVPSTGWNDIVLPDETAAELHHLVARVAHRSQVLDGWGLRRGGGRGEGITALFAGDSGTGKTLGAEVIAFALDLELYVIDLSTVVDKYVGETEKNLERIFSEAEGVNGVLFFDEADALFGKRSEVSDARDRYANVEVAYLLQRMEQFDGLAILASNLRGNLDEAFARRLSMIIDFPEPDAAMRRRLWSTLLADVPLSDDVDFDLLAERFELTGGNIRNVAVTAAYLAADAGSFVDMSALMRGVLVEYRKLGRLCLPGEFGDLVTQSSGGTNHSISSSGLLMA